MRIEVTVRKEAGSPIGERSLRSFSVAVLVRLSRDPSFRWLKRHRKIGLSVSLTTPARIRTLNRKFRKKNKATNVLTFPLFPDRRTLRKNRDQELELGDIVVAPAVVAMEAKAARVSFYQQFSWTLLHGILHVLALDHERSPGEARLMRRWEKKLLQVLRIS